MTAEQQLRVIAAMLNDDEYRDFIRDCGPDYVARSVLSIISGEPDAFAKHFAEKDVMP